jgi:hypothetical protein
VNKVFRSVLTGVISVGLFSALTIAPAHAALDREDPITDISLAGTPKVGSTLTLTKQTYSFPEVVFAVSWLRCNSATSLSNKASEIEALLNPTTCTMISRSTSTTYTITAADAGKHITGAVYIKDVSTGLPTNDGTSVAKSLFIPNTTNATPKKDPAFPKVATKVKKGKKFTIALSATKGTSAKGANADGLATVVTVSAASKKICSVTKIVNKKSKKITGYTIKGLKAGTCTVVVSITGNSKFKTKSKTTPVAVS